MSKIYNFSDTVNLVTTGKDFASGKGGKGKNNNNQPKPKLDEILYQQMGQYDAKNLEEMLTLLKTSFGGQNVTSQKEFDKLSKAITQQLESANIARANRNARIATQEARDTKKLALEESKADKKLQIETDGGRLSHALVNNNSIINQLANLSGQVVQEKNKNKKTGKIETTNIPIGDYLADKYNARLKGEAGVTALGHLEKSLPAAIKGAGQLKENIFQGVTSGVYGKKSAKADKIRAKVAERQHIETFKDPNDKRKKVSIRVANEGRLSQAYGKPLQEVGSFFKKYGKETRDENGKLIDSGSRVDRAIGSSLTKLGTSISNIGVKRDQKALAKADRLQREEKEQYIYNKIDKVRRGTVDVATGLKDFVSEKSLAKRIQKEGYEGIARRNARIKYMLGDRSWKTKALSGHGTNIIQRVQGKQAARKQVQNTKNYFKQFSEEPSSKLESALVNFSELIETLEESSGIEGKMKEYQTMYDILNMDFESLDQKLIEEGQFSEGVSDVETPVDGRPVNPDALKIGDGELTLADVLNKNFYEAPVEEKKFQEMVARGFSEDENTSNDYESFLGRISTEADSFRMR